MNNSARLVKDYSASSLDILSKRISSIFSEKIPDATLWVPDAYQWPDGEGKILDVVFFGDFFRKFLETGNWVYPEYRFWGLGQPTKKFFNQMVGLDDNRISIIPRNLIYPLPDESKFSKTQSLNYVYAGRLTPSKRILTLLWSVYYLQKSGADISLFLYGEFFEEQKFCDCPSVSNPYKDQILGLIENLDWTTRPSFEGRVASHEWINNHKNATYCSFSVLPFEDFSVSIAQAQEAGWDCLLTNWGVHKEIGGKLIKIPLQILESITESEESAKRDGKVISDFIRTKSMSLQSWPKEEFIVPEVISVTELDNLRRAFLKKWGVQLQDVIRHRTDSLSGSLAWKAFMKEYSKCFL